MNVVEGFRLVDPQALEQREDDQGCEPLRRRRRVVDSAAGERDLQRLAHDRAVAFEIAAGDRATGALEIGGDFAPDVATIEIVQALMRQMLQSRGKRGLSQSR